MQTIETLKRNMKNANDLLSVVQTMKALAAVSIRQNEKAVAALAEYNRTVEMGLHVVLRNQQEPIVEAPSHEGEQIGVLLFGSDQGLCGQLNERIATFAINKLNGMHIRREHRSVIAIGERVVAQLAEAGQPVATTFGVPSSLQGVTHLVQELLFRVADWRSKQEIQRVLLFYNQPLAASLYQQKMIWLLPLDLAWLHDLQQTSWPSHVLPIFNLPAGQLFSSLIRQHLFVTLYRACAEALTVENASRLNAMQNAEKNIQEHLVELTTRFHHQRQQAITSELLDIVAGYEAVMSRE